MSAGIVHSTIWTDARSTRSATVTVMTGRSGIQALSRTFDPCDRPSNPKPHSGRPDFHLGFALPESSLGFSLPRAVEGSGIIPAMTTSVLVVDDDPAFRRLARRLLSAAGLGVVGEAGTVAAATAAARDLRPDAALVDVGLPDGDGIALAGELAALPWDLRVVLTSTDADAASPEDVRRSGANCFVPKADLPNVPLLRLLARE
jgi:CheY-like chemotaxis protein